MKKNVKYILLTLAAKAAILVLSIFIIQWLWNLIIPGITGWTEITAWQSLGLVVLVYLITGKISADVEFNSKDNDGDELQWEINAKEISEQTSDRD